jgi:hypothetical protein
MRTDAEESLFVERQHLIRRPGRLTLCQTIMGDVLPIIFTVLVIAMVITHYSLGIYYAYQMNLMSLTHPLINEFQNMSTWIAVNSTIGLATFITNSIFWIQMYMNRTTCLLFINVFHIMLTVITAIWTMVGWVTFIILFNAFCSQPYPSQPFGLIEFLWIHMIGQMVIVVYMIYVIYYQKT